MTTDQQQLQWQQLLDREQAFPPLGCYLSGEGWIRCRIILIDWMLEIVRDMKWMDAIWHLAVSLLDRYLSRSSVLRRSSLQCAASAALAIAAEYIEDSPLDHRYDGKMSDLFVWVSAGSFTAKEFKSMKSSMCLQLDYRVDTAPTVQEWLYAFLADVELLFVDDLWVGTMGLLSRYDYTLLTEPSSALAAAVLVVVRGDVERANDDAHPEASTSALWRAIGSRTNDHCIRKMKLVLDRLIVVARYCDEDDNDKSSSSSSSHDFASTTSTSSQESPPPLFVFASFVTCLGRNSCVGGERERFKDYEDHEKSDDHRHSKRHRCELKNDTTDDTADENSHLLVL
jgi:hypothetical protein